MKDAYEATSVSEMENPHLNCEVTIKMAKNGVIVRAWYRPNYDSCEPCGPSSREKEYVFESLDEALKEIPAIMSVTKQVAKDTGKDKEMDEDE